VIHDIRFENIDDFNLLNKEESSDYSLNSNPLNPNLAEKSIRDIIAQRKISLAKKLTFV
jgi:hypothetical protein